MNIRRIIFRQRSILFTSEFSTIIHKYAKAVATKDEKLVNSDKSDFNHFKNNLKNSPIATFFDHYANQSIEGILYTDERFGNAVIDARSENENKFVLEGVNAIADAIDLNCKMVALYFTHRNLLTKLPYKNYAKEANVYFVRRVDMKKISNLNTPPGIIGIFERVAPGSLLKDSKFSKHLPVTLIVDNVRDPGNLGTIIRTAAAFNLNKILLTKGCVSLYNEKVIRASMTGFLSCPVFEMSSWDEIKNALNPNTQVHIADIRQNTEEISDDLFKYYEDGVVNFQKDSSYGLIIGGEINGISIDAKNLSTESGGVSLTIPTASSMICLNSAISTAIILSEFQRRFLTSLK